MMTRMPGRKSFTGSLIPEPLEIPRMDSRDYYGEVDFGQRSCRYRPTASEAASGIPSTRTGAKRNMAGRWVMKTFQYNPCRLLMIAIACGFVTSAVTQAAAPSWNSAPRYRAALTDNAHLFVWRAADFGTLIFLQLYIDGIRVTTLGRNEGYEAILRPGQHDFSIGTTPCPYGRQKRTHRRVDVRPGQTYGFTALWQYADHAVLETSDATNHVRPVLY
jgi:hypothetical protein